MSRPHLQTPRAGSALLPAASAWQWQEDGACRDSDAETFFDTDPDMVAAAKRVCASCPLAVRETCLDYAISTPERYGVWGGFSQEERATERLRRVRGYPARYQPPAPGYRPSEPVSPEQSIRLARELLTTGTLRKVAEETGVEAKTLRRLVGQSPQSYVTEETERKIVAAHGRVFGKSAHTVAA